jgi:hypothetical protein
VHYPAWAFQPRLITYLGNDPFNNPALGRPKGNETSCVAFLSIDAPLTLGQKMKQNRLKLRKTRKQMARFLHPFCHLVIKAVRMDSHPFTDTIPNALIVYRLRNKMTKSIDVTSLFRAT